MCIDQLSYNVLTYGEHSRANMRRKILFERTTCSKFIARRYHPNTHRVITTYPPVDLVVFVVARVQVFVINLYQIYVTHTRVLTNHVKIDVVTKISIFVSQLSFCIRSEK